MARIRTIKPEFFTSEQVMEISPLSRLLFIGIWPFCDDHGVHVASTKTLKAEVFPADDISLSDIDDLMAELFSQRLVVEYSANGRNYWHVTGWERHQKIDKPNYKHPFPYEQNQIVIKDSTTIRRPFDDHSTTESNGMESNGMDIKTSTTAARAQEVIRLVLSEKQSDLKRLFPKIDIPVVAEKLLSHYSGKSPPLDPWMITLKWFQNEKDRGENNGNGRTSGSTTQAGRKTGIIAANGPGTDFLS